MARLWLTFTVLFVSAALQAAAQVPYKAPPPLSPRGLVTKTSSVSPGYVLFSQSLSDTILLLDNDGRVVHRWRNPHAGGALYLQPNGHILRGARDPNILHFKFGGIGGILQELDWDGKVVWEWKLGDEKRVLHHDIKPLPNGNVLALVWERKTREEAIAAGRRPDAVPEQGLMADWLIEIEPVRPSGARIVWEWHVWDHLVQDHDPRAPGYGDPAARPERLDANAGIARTVSNQELAQLQALGYVAPTATPEDLRADFLHMNAVDYHPGLDQIALSVPALGEVWILDHSTTTAEAAGSRGGRAGRGGDLLYRWGNPAAYGRGEGSRQRLFFQHDVRWIREGFERAGNLTVFNNGRDRPERLFSSVEEIRPPLGPAGTYALEDGKPYGPAELAWIWEIPTDRFSPFISGAERLANGNTFVCAGADGILLEVNAAGEIVWEYRNPYTGDVRLVDGSFPNAVIGSFPYAVFRATRIPPDHAGLTGRKLAPLDPQPPWAPPPTSAP